MDPLHSISVFVRVAEARSFTAGAQRLGVSPSAASKSITRLESRLGVRLLNRTTRSVSLTEDGHPFYERCRQILGELEDAETALTRQQQQPRGRLRVVAPPGFGRTVLVPMLVHFSESFRAVTVDVELSNRTVDLAEEGVDVSIRIGKPSTARVFARKLCDIRYVAVASPDYLARHGMPRSPEDLARHQCLGHHLPYLNRYRNWTFTSGNRRLARPVAGRLNMNDGAALLDAALRGAGIATVATFLAADAVKAGRLAIVLRRHVTVGPAVWVEYLERRHLSSRVRAFVDFLTSEVPASTDWDSILD